MKTVRDDGSAMPPCAWKMCSCWAGVGNTLGVCLCLTLIYVVMAIVDNNWVSNYHVLKHTANTPVHICASKSKVSTFAERADGRCYMGVPRPCPSTPLSLRDAVPVNISMTTLSDVERQNPDVKDGGRWRPENCSSVYKVAILVPFRQREQHLPVFLRHIHPFLQKQLLDYTIYVVEQAMWRKFNRGFLFNVGVSEALRDQNFDCFIFHDVDLLPENGKNLYHCPPHPIHLSTSLSKWNYSNIYPLSFGGVTAMSRVDFIKTNGFSNRFHGWGGEDDDNRLRILDLGLKAEQRQMRIGRYTAIGHKAAEPNPIRFKLLKIRKSDRLKEGLSTIDYQLLKSERRPLYTWILVKPRYAD